MTNLWRFVAITFIAPFLTTVLFVPAFGSSAGYLLFGYPIFVLGTAVLLPVVHGFIVLNPPSRTIQLLISLGTGFAVTALCASFFLWDRLSATVDSVMSLLGFALIGGVHAAVIWVMYTFGPFKIASATRGRSDDRDAN